MSESSPPPLPPLTHIALTVRDLERSAAWYAALFGEVPFFTGEFLVDTPHHYRASIWRTPNLGLHCFANATKATDESFDARRPGLDHVAFACSTIEELNSWANRLDSLQITRGDILTEPYGSGLAFVDPDGIALEFFVATRGA
jgi:glyoxylase I family protein